MQSKNILIAMVPLALFTNFSSKLSVDFRTADLSPRLLENHFAFCCSCWKEDQIKSDRAFHGTHLIYSTLSKQETLTKSLNKVLHLRPFPKKLNSQMTIKKIGTGKILHQLRGKFLMTNISINRRSSFSVKMELFASAASHI